MEYIYAAMLLHKAGKEINEAAMEAVLKAAGIAVDNARIKATVAALKDVDINDVIANASIAATATAPASAPAGEEKPAEEKKEEEDKGASEEEAAAGLGALFG